MANLGNVWHIPANPEPRTRGGMRDPIGAIVPGTAVTIITGNQFQGPGGNPGNQLQDGSALLFKNSTDVNFTEIPLFFNSIAGNNKYYTGTIPAGAFAKGAVAQYYLRIAYDDHDTTFIYSDGGAGSATAVAESTARSAPFSFTVEDSAVKGQWGPVFNLPNVAVHAHVVPDGRVLMWGRRDNPGDSLDVHECTPFVWNPQDNTVINTPQPKRGDGTKVNLFCSGHSFLTDGRLLVIGGHNADSDGLNQAVIYDWKNNTWTATAPMTTPNGEPVPRWYPTATTLANGDVLVTSGSFIDPARPPGKQTVVVDLIQIWSNGVWKTISKADGTPLNFIGLPLYPRLHVVSDGRVFMTGTNDRTLLLKTTAPGEFTEVGFRSLGNRDYCPSIMYDDDKFIYIGGGNNLPDHAPTAQIEIINLNANPRKWMTGNPMKFPRRQHNALVLPDGTVLVTGGTRGGGGPNTGFNDLNAGQPVHTAELWDPNTENFTELTAESVDRCYHSTLVLLPDATVLSAGSGEYRPDNQNPNDPQDSHRDAQIFSPPYLFKGPRPVISSAPAAVTYGERFDVSTSQVSQIDAVRWIRLSSVTHSFNENAHVNLLPFNAGSGKISVTAPASANASPPGHYMLFLVNDVGVPSVAKIIQLNALAPPAGLVPQSAEEESPLRLAEPELVALNTRMAQPRAYFQIYAREAEVAQSAAGTRTQVTIGITGRCPYGIGSCWGGAYEALGRLQDIAFVSPVPDTNDSTAEVVLRDERLPQLDRWEKQFHAIVNGTYDLRGVEVTLQGVIRRQNGGIVLVSRGNRPNVQLNRLESDEKIQWNHQSRERKSLEESEASAYDRLAAESKLPTNLEVTVTGPLKQIGDRYEVHVRCFTL
jgi:galactose oxidase